MYTHTHTYTQRYTHKRTHTCTLMWTHTYTHNPSQHIFTHPPRTIRTHNLSSHTRLSPTVPLFGLLFLLPFSAALMLPAPFHSLCCLLIIDGRFVARIDYGVPKVKRAIPQRARDTHTEREKTMRKRAIPKSLGLFAKVPYLCRAFLHKVPSERLHHIHTHTHTHDLSLPYAYDLALN